MRKGIPEKRITPTTGRCVIVWHHQTSHLHSTIDLARKPPTNIFFSLVFYGHITFVTWVHMFFYFMLVFIVCFAAWPGHTTRQFYTLYFNSPHCSSLFLNGNNTLPIANNSIKPVPALNLCSLFYFSTFPSPQSQQSILKLFLSLLYCVVMPLQCWHKEQCITVCYCCCCWCGDISLFLGEAKRVLVTFLWCAV